MTDLSSWTAYFQDFGQFFNGFLFTLALAIGSFILAMVLGVFFGAMSTSKRPILRILARIFVEFYQNTPLLVQFVIVFYGLPLISDHTIMIPIYWTAVLCVGLYHGAYIAEVIRSGIQSLHPDCPHLLQLQPSHFEPVSYASKTLATSCRINSHSPVKLESFLMVADIYRPQFDTILFL